MSNIFAAGEILLDVVNLLDGTTDPSTGGGVARVIGSIYTKNTATPGLYYKTTAAATGWEKLALALGWKSILDYGAVADGTTDSTANIQQAITDVSALGGGVVYVPRGTFAVTALTFTGTAAVQLVGGGPGSVIKWLFNAATVAGSMITVSAGAGQTRFANLKFDGSGLTNPAASRLNHLLAIGTGAGGAVTETRVEQCVFTGLPAASGDGVHVLGAAGNLVSRLWIHDNVFDGCSRFGVGCEQGWQFGWITSNYFTNCETDVAIVATANVNTDCINISENEIVHTGAVRHAVRLEGNATGLITRMLFAKNILFGGFATLSAIQYGQCFGNAIFSGAFASADPVVRAFGGFSDSTIYGNIVDRDPGASAGTCITIESSGGVAPTRFKCGTNILIPEVASSGAIKIVDGTRFTCSNNSVRATNAGASTIHAFDVQAVATNLDDAVLQGNQVTAAAGTFLSAFRLLANGANVLNVSMCSNQGNQIANGATFEVGGGGGNFTTNVIMLGGNNFNSSTADFTNVGGAGVVPRVGFNAGAFGANLFSGDGTPEAVVAARISSMYLNRTGGQATAVWYKETGAGTNTGWIGIGGSMIVFGSGDLTAVATAVFFAPGYVTTSPAAEPQMAVTRSGNIRNLRVQVATAGTTAATVTYTVRKNGVDTTLLTTLGNTATGLASDVTHSFTVVSTDLLSISVLKSGAVATGQTNVIASLELV